MSIFLVLCLVILTYGIWIKLIYHRHGRNFPKTLYAFISNLSNSGNRLLVSGKNVPNIRALIITAHPDDECMFFAPTILRLMELNSCVRLMCLSRGDYYNQGTKRSKELLDSCAQLRIPASNVTILDHKELPDDPHAEWSISLLSSLIAEHIKAHSINMVLTFDGTGVSGHANHVAIHGAASYLASIGKLPEDCHLLSLETVGLLRKYLFCLDIPLSWLMPSCLCCIIGSEGYRQAKEAMFCHRTQLLWFRYLYIMFSRYMLVNTFQRIPHGPKNLKIF